MCDVLTGENENDDEDQVQQGEKALDKAEFFEVLKGGKACGQQCVESKWNDAENCDENKFAFEVCFEGGELLEIRNGGDEDEAYENAGDQFELEEFFEEDVGFLFLVFFEKIAREIFGQALIESEAGEEADDGGEPEEIAVFAIEFAPEVAGDGDGHGETGDAAEDETGGSPQAVFANFGGVVFLGHEGFYRGSGEECASQREVILLIFFGLWDQSLWEAHSSPRAVDYDLCPKKITLLVIVCLLNFCRGFRIGP